MDVHALLRRPTISKTTTAALTAREVGLCINADATAGAFTITLNASAVEGDEVFIRKSDSSANRVTVAAASADVAWLSVQQDFGLFRYTGSAWVVVDYAIAPVFSVHTASGTETIPPLAKVGRIETISGGCGGGSGRRGAAASARAGGGGGGAGVLTRREMSAVLLRAVAATLGVTVGAGGSGGTAVAVDSTDGNSGSVGGVTTVTSGGVVIAQADAFYGFGSGGTASGSSGGDPSVLLGLTGEFISGNGGGSSVTVAALGGRAAPIGGGGGGGGITTGNTALAGGGGGGGGSYYTRVVAGPTGASAGAGTAGTAITNPEYQAGGTGGAGASGRASSAGYAGGVGGAPGGGGGGGGASVNGSASGAGGAGGRGEARFLWSF